MTTWVLILTIVFGEGTSITSASGFRSKESCTKAGQEWLSHTGKNMYLEAKENLSFVCVAN
jgi:hypothetical protein